MAAIENEPGALSGAQVQLPVGETPIRHLTDTLRVDLSRLGQPMGFKLNHRRRVPSLFVRDPKDWEPVSKDDTYVVQKDVTLKDLNSYGVRHRRWRWRY